MSQIVWNSNVKTTKKNKKKLPPAIWTVTKRMQAHEDRNLKAHLESGASAATQTSRALFKQKQHVGDAFNQTLTPPRLFCCAKLKGGWWTVFLFKAHPWKKEKTTSEGHQQLTGHMQKHPGEKKLLWWFGLINSLTPELSPAATWHTLFNYLHSRVSM